MRRVTTPQGDRIEFETEDESLAKAFREGAAAKRGADEFVRNLCLGIGQAKETLDLAWHETHERARQAGLIGPGSQLMYHYVTADFTEVASKEKPYLVQALQEVKVLAQQSAKWWLAARLRDEIEALQKAYLERVDKPCETHNPRKPEDDGS